jgi:hypothetical protein
MKTCVTGASGGHARAVIADLLNHGHPCFSRGRGARRYAKLAIRGGLAAKISRSV